MAGYGDVALAVDLVQHDGDEIQWYALFLYNQIWLLKGVISGHAEGIRDLYNFYVAIHGPIIAAIFTVQTVNTEMHSATWWTLPILLAIASGGIIAAIALKIFLHFTASVKAQRLAQQLDTVLHGIQSALLMRRNPNLFFRLQSMRIEVNLSGGLSLRLWCAQMAAILVILTAFSLVILVSCKRLAC